ncbi:MAG: hypothetical protein K0S74_1583 [Chlamydiales bacterium]|jgi:hypothetical protein|nr:hypothetical protein [Chlamydiales bacterium]
MTLINATIDKFETDFNTNIKYLERETMLKCSLNYNRREWGKFVIEWHENSFKIADDLLAVIDQVKGAWKRQIKHQVDTKAIERADALTDRVKIIVDKFRPNLERVIKVFQCRETVLRAEELAYTRLCNELKLVNSEKEIIENDLSEILNKKEELIQKQIDIHTRWNETLSDQSAVKNPSYIRSLVGLFSFSSATGSTITGSSSLENITTETNSGKACIEPESTGEITALTANISQEKIEPSSQETVEETRISTPSIPFETKITLPNSVVNTIEDYKEKSVNLEEDGLKVAEQPQPESSNETSFKPTIAPIVSKDKEVKTSEIKASLPSTASNVYGSPVTTNPNHTKRNPVNRGSGNKYRQ